MSPLPRLLNNKHRGKLTCDQRNQVATLYASGRSIGSLAKEFGVPAKNIRGLIIARGVPIRSYVVPLRTRRRKYRASPEPVHERWATKQVELAVRRGDLKRPSQCSECLSIGKVQGHHDDYNFPLQVRWLCRKCHIDWHSLNIPIASKRKLVREQRSTSV